MQGGGVELVVLGAGCGSTSAYSGEASSCHLIREAGSGKPLLLLDAGLGAVRACSAALAPGQRPPSCVWVSHNHSDHAGELPVLLAVEAANANRLTLLAEAQVLQALVTHRLAELASTGRPPAAFANLQPCSAGVRHELPCGLALLPLQSRHAERCFGLLVFWQGEPVLGWTADSGYDARLYSQLALAPLVLADGRAKGASEHASFAQLQAAAASGIFRGARLLVCGYGRAAEAPSTAAFPALQAALPGMVLPLLPGGPRIMQQQQQQQPAGGALLPREPPLLASAPLRGSSSNMAAHAAGGGADVDMRDCPRAPQTQPQTGPPRWAGAGFPGALRQGSGGAHGQRAHAQQLQASSQRKRQVQHARRLSWDIADPGVEHAHALPRRGSLDRHLVAAAGVGAAASSSSAAVVQF